MFFYEKSELVLKTKNQILSPVLTGTIFIHPCFFYKNENVSGGM